MKLLMIYGSPAVGKLTVAGEIAKLTDFKVFHNHLTIDCIEPIFGFGSPGFFKLVHLIRVETVAEAARQDINLVYTFCYAKDFDDPHVEKITQAVEENGGEVCFCLLIADKDEIERRVMEDSRKKYGKAHTPAMLHQLYEKYDLFSPINNYDSLIIDNTELEAEAAAQQIVEYFNL